MVNIFLSFPDVDSHRPAVIKFPNKIGKNVIKFPNKFTLILSFITLMKANEKTIEGLLEELSNNYPESEEPYHVKRNRVVLTEVIKAFE